MAGYIGTGVASLSTTGADIDGNITVDGTVDGRDVSVDGTKLDGIEASATADQTNAEIKTAVEAGADISLGGNPTTTTQSAGNNTTRVATTAFTQAAITALVDSSPASLNTLNELAAALGDDANFSTTVTNSIAAKLPLAGGALTGNVTFGDSNKIVMGAGSDLNVFHNGSHSYVQDSGTGNLYLAGSNVIISNPTSSETMAYFDDDGGASLWYNNAVKIATTNTGIEVTGTAIVDRIQSANDSSDPWLKGTNSGGTETSYVKKDGQAYLAGHVLVGGTSATPWSLTSGSGAVVRSEGYAGFAASGAAIELNRVGSDGNIANFRRSGTTVGSIGGSSNILSITGKDGNGGIAIQNNSYGDIVYPASNTSGGASNGAIDLGYNNGRWKDLYLSGGVFLGGTGTANKISDYETGTWTPSLAGLSNTPSYYNLTGKYTKIGRHVTVQYFAQTGGTAPTFSSSTAEMKVTGLPFTVLGSGYSGSQGTVNSQAFHYHGSNNNQASVGSAAVGGCYLTAAVTNGASPVMQFLVTSSGNTRGIVNNAGAAQGFILEATVTYFTT